MGEQDTRTFKNYDCEDILTTSLADLTLDPRLVSLYHFTRSLQLSRSRSRICIPLGLTFDPKSQVESGLEERCYKFEILDVSSVEGEGRLQYARQVRQGARENWL